MGSGGPAGVKGLLGGQSLAAVVAQFRQNGREGKRKEEKMERKGNITPPAFRTAIVLKEAGRGNSQEGGRGKKARKKPARRGAKKD